MFRKKPLPGLSEVSILPGSQAGMSPPTPSPGHYDGLSRAKAKGSLCGAELWQGRL